jgi:hypothetical protein
MKKLLLLLLLSVLGYGQVPNGLELTNIIPINANNFKNDDFSNPQNILTVPNAKYWTIYSLHTDPDEVDNAIYIQLPLDNSEFVGVDNYNNNLPDSWIKLNPRYSRSSNYSEDLAIKLYYPTALFIPSGTKLHFGKNISQYARYAAKLVYEYSPTNSNNFSGTLSVNEAKFINENKPTLFPNPTSYLLALNSDKEYDIEVYDMLGNKLMALTGNSINMEHLSTATYIVKATDKSNNEELTYKVVKN